VQPIVDWALARLRERAPGIRDLETVHEHLDNHGAEAAAQALTAASVDVDFRLSLHGILARLLPELPDAVYAGSDGRPMYRVRPGLLVDARPVSTAEFERFLIQSGRDYPADWEHGADPARAARRVSLTDARAYADWARKRLPSDPEWEQAVAALGAEKLATGEVWEWTASPHPELGWVVRGGRWRDRPDQDPDPSHRSCEVGPASDLGFRLVVDG